MPCNSNNFSILFRVFGAKCFNPKLVELPLSSFLRTFSSKERPHIIKSLERCLSTQIMLNKRTNHRCCQFRAKSETGTILIFPTVHFFGDNICLLTHTSGKEPRFLKNGSPNFIIPKSCANFSYNRFKGLPAMGVYRQNIMCTFYTSNWIHSATPEIDATRSDAFSKDVSGTKIRTISPVRFVAPIEYADEDQFIFK